MASKYNLSKYISLILRHHPESIGISLDEHGWADVEKLISGIAKTGRVIDRDILENIVATDEKGRYSFNEDHSKIRANHGHSVQVDLELEEQVPPDILYHGTATRFLRSIEKEGLKKMQRMYVHLSKDYDTAVKVGSRHGQCVVFQIDAKKMYEDGEKFYQSQTGVWLTDHVDLKYMSLIKPMETPDVNAKDMPYIHGKYNPEYGDDRVCVCGHTYYRHFDSYDNMAPVGCKYCDCTKFRENKES